MKEIRLDNIICHTCGECGSVNGIECEDCLGYGIQEGYDLVSDHVDWRAYHKVETQDYIIRDMMTDALTVVEYYDDFVPLQNVLVDIEYNQKEVEKIDKLYNGYDE